MNLFDLTGVYTGTSVNHVRIFGTSYWCLEDIDFYGDGHNKLRGRGFTLYLIFGISCLCMYFLILSLSIASERSSSIFGLVSCSVTGLHLLSSSTSSYILSVISYSVTSLQRRGLD